MAVSGTATFSTKKGEVEIGDTFFVVFTVESSDVIGSIEAYVAFDEEILKFKSGGSLIEEVGAGMLHISDLNGDAASEKKTYSMKFKAKKAGACEVALRNKPIVTASDTGEEMSISNNRLSISVKETIEKLSSETSLKSLAVSPGTLAPEFNPEVSEYKIVVSNKTKEISVLGLAKDEKAKVSVKGNEELQERENIIVVTVTAPSGKKRKYKIRVEWEEFATPNPSPSQGDGEIDGEDFLIIQEEERTFIEREYRYEVVQPEEAEEVPSGYVATKVILFGVKLSAYTMENDLDNDFFLLYCENEQGDSGFYQYDRIEKTLQRYNGDTIKKVNEDASKKKVQPEHEYSSKLTQLAVVIALLSALCVFLLISIIRLFLRVRGMVDDDLG